MVTAPLRDLAAAVSRSGIANPAVIVIGDVAQLASSAHLLPGAPTPEDGLPEGGTPRDDLPGGGTPTPHVTAVTPATATIAAPHASGVGSPPPRRVLVLGGARSGKSATAEAMLASYSSVDYIASGDAAGCG